MARGKPDKLDIKLVELESKRNSLIRYGVLDYHLRSCRISEPECPYLVDTSRICPKLQRVLKHAVRKASFQISEEN